MAILTAVEVLPLTITVAPSAAKANAVASPIPPVDAEISTVLLFNPRFI
jgi:hypothetical protein